MNWQRSETKNGIPYYINHMTERTQWDHPKLVKAMTDIGMMDNICYTAYRSAMKLRHLQKVLRLDLIELSSLSNALHNCLPQTHIDNFIMDAHQLRKVVLEIFSLTRNRGRGRVSTSECTDLLVNWILNVYDSQRTGYIFLKSFEVAIAALCSGRILQKYKYLFQAFCFDGGHMSKQGLEKMIRALVQITDFLGETTNLGAGVSATVNSCLSTVFMSSVSQDEFVSWMMSEPQTLIWLPTLHRLSAAESVKHKAKCNICKCHPMVGFRYQCLKCLNFDICQTCFLTGRSTRHHRYTHPIQEYCLGASSRDEMKAFVRTVRNKVSKKHGRRLKQKYLAVEEDKQTDGQDHQYHHDNHFQTHLHLGQLSKQLEAVELDPVFQSRNQGAKSKQTDDSINEKSQAGVKDNLEELIDALEKENENLAAELVNYYQEMQEKQRAPVPKMTSASSSVSSREDEERRVKQEILEEHNKRLEDELLRYRELIRKEQRFDQRPTYHPASLDKTAPPRLEPYGQSEPQLDKIGTNSYNQHASIVSQSSDPMPSMSHSFFRTPANPDLVAPLSKDHTSLVSQSSDTMPFMPSSFFRSSANPIAPVLKDYAISSSDHTPDRFPNGSLDAIHSHKPAYSSLIPQVVTADPAVDNNSFRISGVNDRTTSPDGFSFQSRDEPDSQSLTIGNRVWPPHLVDESTVRFPNMSVTRVFPTDEAKLDEMVEKMTAALDHSNFDGHPKADSDTFCAVNRLGEAMQQLVSEITMATNVV